MSERQRERDEKEEEGGKIKGGKTVREWADQGKGGSSEHPRGERFREKERRGDRKSPLECVRFHFT